MSLFVKLFKNMIKYILTSLILTTLSVIASISLINGKFPPDWKQFKNTVVNLKQLQNSGKIISQLGEYNPLIQNQNHRNNELLTNLSINRNKEKLTINSQDPEIEELQGILATYQQRRDLAQALNGSNSLSSTSDEIENTEKNKNFVNNNKKNTMKENQIKNEFTNEQRLQHIENEIAEMSANMRTLNLHFLDLKQKFDSSQKKNQR